MGITVFGVFAESNRQGPIAPVSQSVAAVPLVRLSRPLGDPLKPAAFQLLALNRQIDEARPARQELRCLSRATN